jgi:hypothetical protein
MEFIFLEKLSVAKPLKISPEIPETVQKSPPLVPILIKMTLEYISTLFR